MFAFGDDLPHDVDALGFEPLQVGQARPHRPLARPHVGGRRQYAAETPLAGESVVTSGHHVPPPVTQAL